jgi:hypothetical protein
MLINGIEFDPAQNPGVLDTMTWNPEAAVQQVQAAKADLKAMERAIGLVTSLEDFEERLGAVETKDIWLFPRSACFEGSMGHILACLPDGQRVFLTASLFGGRPPMEVIGEVAIGWAKVRVSPVNTDSVARLLAKAASRFAPRALGSTARLGIGNRQTVTVWPGVFAAVRKIGRPAEAIQNSAYRELAPKDFILAPPSAEAAYLPGHGSLNIGHTGTSIEGLWLAGVVSAMEDGFSSPYGADLDHIPVKGLDEGSISRAKHLIELGRRYTFFTLDTAFLFKPDAADLEGRYGDAIEAGAIMFEHIRSLKGSDPFDFEFSLDEGPALTTPEEQEFVLKGLADRGVTVNFVAPNVGFEKRQDYRLPDGLAGLEGRVRALSECAEKHGALLDFHSGSDKSSATYQTISRACGGRLKLKVSGKLQLILSEVLADLDPDFFGFWWDWTLKTAEAEAASGSEVAAKYLELLRQRRASDGANFRPSPHDPFFTDFSFAMVGAKDEAGRFLYRDRFYSLTPQVQGEYTRRVKDYLIRLAEDLGLRS